MMRSVNGVLAILLLAGAQAAAQQLSAGVWFSSPSPTGASADARFEVQTTPTGTVILWAPFGKSPATWGPVTGTADGAIAFHWAGNNPPLLCTLRPADERNYEGTCHGAGQIERRLLMSRNQPPNGLDLPVSDTDFRILRRARHILSGSSVWNRHDDRYCEDDAKQNSWSLFCAFYRASIDVAGEYIHLRPVMEEVRAVVGEITAGRSFRHQLMDYNNLESTTYAEVKAILGRTEKRLQTRKACTESRGSRWSEDARIELPVPNATVPQGADVVYWGEGLSYTAQGKTYRLREMLGPMANAGKVPGDWLAASTTVTRRTWKHNGFDGVDVKGTLSNGNHWRYFCLCGESWRYHDVPAEAAAFFDRVINGAYSPDGHR